MGNNIFESKWSQIENRLNLQSIGGFIQHGGDIPAVDKHNFTERGETAYRKLTKYLESTCGTEQTENILEQIALYTGIREDIYFSLGMKVGAQIMIQLTTNLEADF